MQFHLQLKICSHEQSKTDTLCEEFFHKKDIGKLECYSAGQSDYKRSLMSVMINRKFSLNKLVHSYHFQNIYSMSYMQVLFNIQ